MIFNFATEPYWSCIILSVSFVLLTSVLYRMYSRKILVMIVLFIFYSRVFIEDFLQEVYVDKDTLGLWMLEKRVKNNNESIKNKVNGMRNKWQSLIWLVNIKILLITRERFITQLERSCNYNEKRDNWKIDIRFLLYNYWLFFNDSFTWNHTYYLGSIIWEI